MDYYFLIITAVDIFVLGTMCVLTKYNETLDKRQRRWFIMSFVLIIVISVLEVVTVAVDRGPQSLRWVNIIANYLGFGLSPAVPIFLAAAMEKKQSIKYALSVEAAYLLFLAVTFPFKLVFYIDQNNQYVREDFFGIYIAVYFSGIIYLLVMTFRITARYQNKSRRSIYLIVAFLLAGMTIQVVFSQIHVTWLCSTFLSILFFTYCNGMWQQLDKLTGLLNQKSYLNITSSLSQSGTMVVFDVDDFKQVNDNCGHVMGDRCLEAIADCIKAAYSKYGFCYRIGGDEFCVMLNAEADREDCYRRLIEELDERRKTLSILPYVSVGSASFAAGDDALKVKEAADRELYRFKREHKKKTD